VLQLLRGHFNGGFKTTGYYAIELYAGRRNKSWLSPSFREDMLRVDVFWYIRNEGDPASENGFFRQFWDLLRNSDIPLRLHWGKFLPEYDFEDWAAYLKSQYPRWDEFMNLRMQRDPNNIFLTDYWRRHLLG
jgi:D-arabinono-1,4-lactone oxidase